MKTLIPPSPEQTDLATVLIIDDDSQVRRSIRRSLEPYYQVREAEDMDAAVQNFLPNPPDAIILDLYLPQANGIEVLRWLKEYFTEVPVILITGHASLRSAEEAVMLGALDYVTKPFDPFYLRVAVENGLWTRHAHTRFTRDSFRDTF